MPSSASRAPATLAPTCSITTSTRHSPARTARAAPVVANNGGRYFLDHDRPKSIGRVRSFFGNVGILLRGYAYIRTLGPDGLKQVSEHAVLNANYLRARGKG